jgi:adenylylsulfate reductase subunit A
LVLDRTVATHLLIDNGAAAGLAAFSPLRSELLSISAKAVLIATGGAAGLYRSNNIGQAKNQSWYCPFNTGGGLAMGIAAGAEMTTLEMRFIALRLRGTMAPTGTMALGVGARQLNALGAPYEKDYGYTTSQRVCAVQRETQLGRGPCRLTASASKDKREDLYRAYLNMCPSQTLKWLENDETDADLTISAEIEASEPYVLGGHTAGGFWVDTNRRTTIKALWAAGDVSGGAPQKYVTGSMAEAEIACDDISEYLRGTSQKNRAPIEALAKPIFRELSAFFDKPKGFLTTHWLDQALKQTMDTYAGGLATHYRYSSAELAAAQSRLDELRQLAKNLKAESFRDLLSIWELFERLTVSKSLVGHLAARKETRWPGFGVFSDFPDVSPKYECYVNSRLEGDDLKIIYRPLVEENFYEHSD